MKATEVTAGLAESNGRLLLGLWRDSLHVTCGLTACTPGSAPGPTLGNEYGKNLPLPIHITFPIYITYRCFSQQRNRTPYITVVWNLAVVIKTPTSLHGYEHVAKQFIHVFYSFSTCTPTPTNSAAITTMFPLRLCGGKPLVAVTRERRYGPSRLRVNDDDDDDPNA